MVSDHVRKYGKDFNKLYSANFKVEEIVPKDIIENDSLRRVLNLNDGEQLFICNKKSNNIRIKYIIKINIFLK